MNTTTNLRRLQNEVRSLQNNDGEYKKMFRIKMVKDDMYHWEVILYGPADSLYEGYQFKLDVKLPNDYPFSAPRIKFLSPILHVNINNKGDICLDILKDKWAASQNITSIMLSIILLLSQPNPDDPFNSELAQLYRENKNKYVDMIKKFCKEHNEQISA